MIIQLRNKFILLLILLYVSLRKCQHYSLLSSSITRRLEESLDFAKQCDICSYRNNTSNYNNHEYKEEDLVTVDAFYYIAWPEENWYIATGDWWLGPSLVDFFTNKHVNGKGRNETKVLVRIHILTYDDNTLIRGRSVGPPYYAYNLSDYQALYDVFHAMYIPNHMSLNTYHYEFLCFYRWIVYSEIVRNWNIANPNDPITRIITMDSDILFMKNVAELFHNVLNSITFIPGKKKEDFELTVLGLGAIHMWSPVGLHKYSDFIYDWYNDSKIDVKENIKSVLGKSKLNGEYHFSDMQLVEVFIKRDGKTRDSCFLHASSLQSNTNDVHSRYRHCLIDYLKCFPLINYSERGNRLITFNKTTMSLKGSHSDYPYCAMHFQGQHSKFDFVIVGLGVMSAARNEYKYEFPFSNNKTYLLKAIAGRPGDSREVYLIEKGERRVIRDWDAFVSLGFDTSDITHCAEGLIKIFPEGPLKVSNDDDV